MDRQKKDFFDYISPFTVRYIKPFIELIKNNPSYLLLLVLGILILIFFFSFLLKAIIISFFIIIGGISRIYQRYTHLAIGFELVLFSTVICGFSYGSIIGVIVGITSFSLATYFSVRYTAYVIPSFLIYIIAGIASHFFENIITAGVTLSVMSLIILLIFDLAIMRSRIDRIIMYSITSVAWNMWLFIYLAPRVINLLS